jgi:hypothetical protein
MSRLRLTDILCELVELSQDRVQEVRQQLVYYRASVYKAETLTQIMSKIDQMRLLSELLCDDALSEAFKDFDAMGHEGVLAVSHGECSFSTRVTRLLADAGLGLDRLRNQIVARGAAATDDQAFTEALRKHRTELLALCRQGSRQWAFFQSL